MRRAILVFHKLDVRMGAIDELHCLHCTKQSFVTVSSHKITDYSVDDFALE